MDTNAEDDPVAEEDYAEVFAELFDRDVNVTAEAKPDFEFVEIRVAFADDVFLPHYDVQFTFDGDEFFEAEECQRVTLTDALVDHFATDSGVRLREFWNAVEKADDIDDEIAPVAWDEAKDYSRTNNAAVITGAAGASTATTNCAGTGAADAAGDGAC